MKSGSRGRCRVLLIEDNAAVRQAFGILLTETGYDVQEAGCGADGLKAAQATSPDVVLLDLGLPDMQGLAVARALKSDPRTAGAAIIALTGRALDSDRRACLEAGCAHYLSKPVGTAVLLELLEGMVSS